MYRIECDNVEVFNSTRMAELPVAEAGLSEQLNEAGSLRFILVHGHPSYGVPEGMATYVKAYDDNEIIFDGRVLSNSLPTFSGQITYECEGALSFLMDSEVTPNKNPMSKTPQEFFEWCIQQHNADIGNDSKRTFQPGNVTISERNKSEKFQISSYTQTKTAIENNLINVYGGYLKVRYDNGVRYLDWLENYSDRINPQAITIGENVIDRAFTNNGEGLFTVLRPVGKNGIVLDTPTIDVFSQAMMTKYGRIVKSVSFSDASTKAALQTKAEEYIARIKKTLLCTGSIKMVDMYYIDGTSPKVKLGDRFNNIEGLAGIEMTVSALERDFLKEYEDSCEFGNEKSLKDEGGRSAGSISKATSRAGASAGMNYKHIIEVGDMVEINAETLNEHGRTLNQHYEQITQTANQVISMSNDMDNMDSRLQTVEGTGVIRNDELLANFAGTMRLVKDNQGIVTGIQFVDGTMVMDTVDGHMVTVGAAIAQSSQDIQTIKGSALWNGRDSITGLVGEFDIHEDPTTHVKTLVIKSGGGMNILRNNVEYGLYDSGNLTGGIVVDKINDGTTTTKIKGTRVVLGTDLTGDDLNTWAADAQNGTGVFAKFLTVKALTAQEITTMLANIKDAEIDWLNVSESVTAPVIAAVAGSGYSSRVSGDVIKAHAHYYIGPEEDEMMILDASVSQDGTTLTITKVDGSTITFRKAAAGKIQASWSGDTLSISPAATGDDSFESIISAGFLQTSNPNKNYISAYHADNGAQQPSEISQARTEIQLGTNAAGTIVQIQNASGSQIINTPTYTIPVVTVGKPTNNSGSLGGNATRTTINIKATASNGESNNKDFTLERSTYTNSSGTTNQRCVILKEGSTAIGRIDVMTDYNAGYTAGNTAGIASGKTTEAASLSVVAPTNNSGSLGGNATRTTINLKSEASTTNSGSKTNNKNFTLERSTYTNSSGTANQRCVILKEGSTAIGRIDVMTDYNAGYSAGKTDGANAAGNSAWFEYSSTVGSTKTSFIDLTTPEITRFLNIKYTNAAGTEVHRTDQKWFLPEPAIFTVSGPGAHHVEDLTPNTYICAGYKRRGYDGGGDAVFSAYTYKVPGNGSSPSYTIANIEVGNVSTQYGPNDSGSPTYGWNPKKISAWPSAATSKWRYLKFTVDGKKRCFYTSN